jgi:hypothetical protein
MNGWSMMLDQSALRRMTDERRERLAAQWGHRWGRRGAGSRKATGSRTQRHDARPASWGSGAGAVC